MKLLFPLTLLAAVGVSAQDKSCAAEYIVTKCISTESGKVTSCVPSDYDCLCSAYQAIATCYNNCPSDARASAARNQEASFCQNASLYGSKALAAKTASMAVSQSTSEAAATTTRSAVIKATSGANSSGTSSGASAAASGTSSSSSSRPTSSGAADALAGSAGGALMAAVGIVAALV